MALFTKKEKKKKRAETKRFPTGFTLMIIPDSSDPTKATEITYDRLVKMFAGAVATTIILVGLIISMMVHNYRLKGALEESQTTITELKDVNVKLGKTITSLNEQVEEDKEAFDKIEMSIDKQEKEVTEALIEAAIPSGVPIKSASAVLIADPFGDTNAASNGLVFQTTAGAVIVATGTGLIEDISNDNIYTKRIVIDHGNGYKTIYHIPNDVTCSIGSEVKRNDMLAVFIEDGCVSYEITKDGVYVDPKSMMITE